MNYITLTANQIALLQRGELFVVKPLKEQPPKGHGHLLTIRNRKLIFANASHTEQVNIKLPFTPDQELVVKEIWGAWPYMGGGVQRDSLRYKADGDYQNEHNAWRWRSPVTMPKWASRYTVTVKGEPIVKRVQKLTCNELIQLGFPIKNDCGDVSGLSEKQIESLTLGSFIQRWNSLHGYPRKYKEGYVCWPYSVDSFIKMYVKSDNVNTGTETAWNWKGKPLTIHGNPVVVMMKMERSNG